MKSLKDFAKRKFVQECQVCALPQELRQQVDAALAGGEVGMNTIGRWLLQEVPSAKITSVAWMYRIKRHQEVCR